MALTVAEVNQLVNAMRILLAKRDIGGKDWAAQAVSDLIGSGVASASKEIKQGSAPTTDGTYSKWTDNSGNPEKVYMLLNDSGGTPQWVGPIAQGPSS